MQAVDGGCDVERCMQTRTYMSGQTFPTNNAQWEKYTCVMLQMLQAEF